MKNIDTLNRYLRKVGKKLGKPTFVVKTPIYFKRIVDIISIIKMHSNLQPCLQKLNEASVRARCALRRSLLFTLPASARVRGGRWGLELLGERDPGRNKWRLF